MEREEKVNLADKSNPKVAELLELFRYHKPNNVQVQLIQMFRDRLYNTADILMAALPMSANVVVACRALHEASMAINAAIVTSHIEEKAEDAPTEEVRERRAEDEGVPRKKKRRIIQTS